MQKKQPFNFQETFSYSRAFRMGVCVAGSVVLGIAYTAFVLATF